MNTIKLPFVVILNIFIFNNAISQTVFPQAKDCKNEIDKKGNRKGDWLISYGAYDWSTSKTNIVIDISHLKEIVVNEVEGTNNISFLENVKYKDGLKNGLAYYYFYNRGNKSASPLAIANFLDGKVNGQVSYFRNFTDQFEIAKVNYNYGVLADQTIEKAPSILTTYQALINHGNIAIRQYEKISSGKSVECQYWIEGPDFQNSEYFALQLLSEKLGQWNNKSVLYREVTNDKLNKTIVCIPFAQDQPEGVVMQFQQQLKIDSLGKVENYGRVKIFQTSDSLNFLKSSGKFAIGIDKKYLDLNGNIISSFRNMDWVKICLGELPWTYFDGISTEKACLIYQAQLDPDDGTPDGDVKTYYCNEDINSNLPNSEKVLKTNGQYTSGQLNGLYKIYYTDKSIAAEMSFKQGKIDGRFTSLFNPSCNFIYVPNFPDYAGSKLYNFDTDKGRWAARIKNSIYFVDIPFVRTSDDLFSELGTISNCNHVKPKAYKEVSYACDFKANKIASDIVYFYNEKNIIFRQGVDLNSFTDKDWTYYNIDGSVCLTQAQAVAMYKAKKEKEQAEIQKQKVNNKSDQNNNSIQSNTKKIGDVKVEGTTALIYDENGNYTNSAVQLGSKGTLSGFNSSYIVVTDGDYVKIHDAYGNYINKGFNLCGGCYVKNVTNSAILVKDSYGTRFYDFNGNYTNKYVND